MPPDPRPITLLCLDVDGVLTDGSIVLDATGNEAKSFSVRDGQGLAVWKRLGFESAIITARRSVAVERRAAELGIAHVVQGVDDKGRAFDELLARLALPPSAAAYMGDDWADLAPLRRCGYPIAPADAEPLIREAAAHVTPRPGGRGAVRDAVEHLLAAKGLLRDAQRLYDPA